MRDERSTEEHLSQFVRGLFFDLQRIDGVKPLEIWNGVRESWDPFELTGLVKNLYKIGVPLANEAFAGRPFEEQGRAVQRSVETVAAWLRADPGTRLFDRFPDPPLGDDEQKRLYQLVKERMQRVVSEAARAGDGAAGGAEQLPNGAFPDGLFDLREMRIVDNELPYIIFTEKEFRVIQGLAITYVWLIDVDAAFSATLERLGVEGGIGDEYRRFVRRVHRENPLTISGRKMSSAELVEHIREKLKYEDYLDLFERVYRWYEAARAKLDK
jgi:hypothetical protein